jgi:hypothetical protein
MRIDYRHYRAPAFIWSGLAFVTWRSSPCCSAPRHNSARRWFGIGGLASSHRSSPS